MKRYRMIARPVSPLIVRRERQSQRSEGVESLSGTLVRGALAQLYLGQRGQADDLFQRLFLEEDSCRYGPLDPAEHVFPLSAASCKRFPGFAGPGDSDPHGIVDLLWLRIARRLLARELPEGWTRSGQVCPRCGQDLKAKTGFWTGRHGKDSEPKKSWRREHDTHVGIDRYSGSAHESILYTLPVLRPRHTGAPTEGEEATLTGVLEAEPDMLEHLHRLLLEEESEVRVGHARSRGYGRVRLEIDTEGPGDRPDPEDWSRELIAFLKRVSPDGLAYLDPERHFFFSVGLPAGALLLDQLLRYTLDPHGMVEWLPPLPPPDGLHSLPGFEGNRPTEGLWCLGGITRHERLRGWNAVHGLPRQDEWVVSRGAVLAYLYQGDRAGRQELLTKLADLETTGLGARRGEGLGRTVISDSFHLRFHPREIRS